MEHICYLSSFEGQKTCETLTGLSLDEIEHVVGRFNDHLVYGNNLKGELCVKRDVVYIRHHFTKKVLWSSK